MQQRVVSEDTATTPLRYKPISLVAEITRLYSSKKRSQYNLKMCDGVQLTAATASISTRKSYPASFGDNFGSRAGMNLAIARYFLGQYEGAVAAADRVTQLDTGRIIQLTLHPMLAASYAWTCVGKVESSL